jgi:hypothetical protein
MTNAHALVDKKQPACSYVFRRLGGSCAVKKPDPIPNSVVKRCSADGTLA